MNVRLSSLIKCSLVVSTLAAALLAGPGGAHAADVGPGSIAVSARLCDAIPVDPTDCSAAGGIGSIAFTATDTGSVLTVAESTIHGGTAVWGETGPVPLTTYAYATDGFQVPDGYAFRDIVVTPNASGPGAGNGWSVSLSEASPAAQLYVIYTPLAAADIDTDGDGASDEAENAFGSDPLDAADFPAVQAGNEPDTDGDGVSDKWEGPNYGTDPTNADTDGDGLGDGEEAVLHTDGTAADTDGDGADDGAEVAFGSDPLDAHDFPAVQAGPEDADDESAAAPTPTTAGKATDADGNARVTVTGLPNTGTGADPDATAAPTPRGLMALAALLGLGTVGYRTVERRRTA